MRCRPLDDSKLEDLDVLEEGDDRLAVVGIDENTLEVLERVLCVEERWMCSSEDMKSTAGS